MKNLIALLISLFYLAGCSTTGNLTEAEIQDAVNKAKSSKIIVLDVHHNHCNPCKKIKPIIEELKQKYSSNPDVAFLVYDLSNPFSKISSNKIAKELNLEEIYNTQRFSGVVLLVDPNKKEVIDTLVTEFDINKYTSAIDSKIQISNVKKESKES